MSIELVRAPTMVQPEHAAFLYLESRLADEARYAEWDALWDDDALYWVPMREDADPEREVAYIYDNRPRIAKRIAQLKTGYRHAQTPPSKMRRLLSNVELLDQTADTVTIGSNFGAAVSTPIAPRRDLPTVDGPGVRVPALR